MGLLFLYMCCTRIVVNVETLVDKLWVINSQISPVEVITQELPSTETSIYPFVKENDLVGVCAHLPRTFPPIARLSVDEYDVSVRDTRTRRSPIRQNRLDQSCTIGS